MAINRAILWIAAASSMALLAACSKAPKIDPESAAGGGAGGNETVRGKVTHNGKPVTYGLVMLYSEFSLDVKSGMFSPIAIGPIGADGTYEIRRLPPGPVEVVVATNPDVESISMVRPVLPGEDPGGPSMLAGPAAAPPPEAKSVVNPHLTEDQRRQLRTLHARYGIYGKSGLSFVIQPGEQTHNIDLK